MGGSNLSLVMYVCFLIPMLLSLFSLGRRERLAVGSILVGATVCLAVSGLNAHLYALTGRDMLYYTTTISPVVEEIVKALPVLIYAFAVSSERDRLISISFAVGLGFAIMENMIIFAEYPMITRQIMAIYQIILGKAKVWSNMRVRTFTSLSILVGRKFLSSKSFATSQSSLYHASPKRRIRGSFRNRYTGRPSAFPFTTASLHTSHR